MRVAYICKDGDKKFTLVIKQDCIPRVNDEVFIGREWGLMKVMNVKWFPYNAMNNLFNGAQDNEVELELFKLSD